MGKREKEKGKRLEREAAARLRGVFPSATIRRGWQTRFGGKDEPDLLGLPWHVEVAGGKQPSILAKVRQALEDSGGKKPILVMTKRDREGWLITMRLEDWARLCDNVTCT